MTDVRRLNRGLSHDLLTRLENKGGLTPTLATRVIESDGRVAEAMVAAAQAECNFRELRQFVTEAVLLGWLRTLRSGGHLVASLLPVRTVFQLTNPGYNEPPVPMSASEWRECVRYLEGVSDQRFIESAWLLRMLDPVQFAASSLTAVALENRGTLISRVRERSGTDEDGKVLGLIAYAQLAEVIGVEIVRELAPELPELCNRARRQFLEIRPEGGWLCDALIDAAAAQILKPYCDLDIVLPERCWEGVKDTFRHWIDESGSDATLVFSIKALWAARHVRMR